MDGSTILIDGTNDWLKVGTIDFSQVNNRKLSMITIDTDLVMLNYHIWLKSLDADDTNTARWSPNLYFRGAYWDGTQSVEKYIRQVLVVSSDGWNALKWLDQDGNVLMQLVGNGNGHLWMKGSLYPFSDNAQDLGSSSYRWKKLYLSDDAIINGAIFLSKTLASAGDILAKFSDAQVTDGYVVIEEGTSSASAFIPAVRGRSVGVDGAGMAIIGQIPDANDSAVSNLAAVIVTGRKDSGALASAYLFMVRNYDTDKFHIEPNGNTWIGGDLKIGGNDIKDSGGTTRITLGQNTRIIPKYIHPGYGNALGLSAGIMSNAFGFNPPYKVEIYNPDTGSWDDVTSSYTWAYITDLKGTEVAISTTAGTEKQIRFYFNVSGWSYGDIVAVVFKMRWIHHLKQVKVESSTYSDFSADVETRLDWSGDIYHWDETTIWLLDSRTYGDSYIRITINISRDSDGEMRIRQIMGLSYSNTSAVLERWLPIDWDYDRNITVFGDLTIKNKISFTNLIAGSDSGLIGSGEGCYIVFPSYTKDTTTYDRIELYRQETWVGFYNRTDTFWMLKLFEDGNLWIAGDLQVNGNDIKDSGGTTRITLGSTVVVNGDLKVSGNDIIGSNGSYYIIMDTANDLVRLRNKAEIYNGASHAHVTMIGSSSSAYGGYQLKDRGNQTVNVWEVDYRVSTPASRCIAWYWKDSSGNWYYRMYLTTGGSLYIDGSYNTYSPKIADTEDELIRDIRRIVNTPPAPRDESGRILHPVKRVPIDDMEEGEEKRFGWFVLERAFSKDIGKIALSSGKLLLKLYNRVKYLEGRVNELEKELSVYRNRIAE